MKTTLSSHRSQIRQGAVLLLFLTCGAVFASAPARSAPPSPRFRPAPEGAGVPDSYIVVLEEDRVRFGDAPAKAALPLVATVADVLVARHGGRIVTSWQSALAAFYVRLPAAAAERMSRDPEVSYVEQVVRMVAPSSATSCFESVAKSSLLEKSHGAGALLDCPVLDPRFQPENGNCTEGLDCYDCSDNWGLARLNQPGVPEPADYRYDYSPPPGAATVHVYALDTGIDRDHGEFAGRIRVAYNAAYKGDPLAQDFKDCTTHGHGTHVAAIAVGHRFGVAKDALLHPIVVEDYCDYKEYNKQPTCPHAGQGTSPCGGNSAALVDAFNYIRETHRARFGAEPAVVNLSLNLAAPSDCASKAARNLAEMAGILVVQSAGNNFDLGDGMDVCSRTLGTPGQPAPVLVAGGSDIVEIGDVPTDVRWIREGRNTNGASPEDPSHFNSCQPDFFDCSNPELVYKCDCGSNTGSCIDVWAPAAHIVSASKADPDAACRLSGTSMAAPHVTGVAALHLQANPGATSQELHDAVIAAAVQGVLYDAPGSAYSIGSSPNRLLQSSLAPPPSPPEAVDDVFPNADFPSRILEDTVEAALPVLANDSPPAGLTIASLGPTDRGGKVEKSADGTQVLYTPASDFSGVEEFTYKASDGSVTTDSALVKVTVDPVNDPPVAVISDASCLGLDCHFESGSFDLEDGTPSSWLWQLGDGTLGSGATVDHRYSRTGLYDVSLAVEDSEGADGTAQTRALAASFSADCDDLRCRFDADPVAGGAGLTGYRWDFGDGTVDVSSGAVAQHEYENDGVYAVRLAITSGALETAAELTIEVEDFTLFLLLILD